MLRRTLQTLLLIAAAMTPAPAAAGEGGVSFAVGRSIADIVEELRTEGLNVAYSSRLLPPDLLVTVETGGNDNAARLLQVLAAHDLTLAAEDGVLLIVRRFEAPERSAAAASAVPSAGGEAIENITVSASRYEISRDVTNAAFRLDQRSIETMPDVGEDPIRIAHRLPGAAASGASARAHFRGGEQGEVGIVLNGQRLFDPFHVRDYQNIFSAIDARAIDGVEVYTGGFPVRFGDRMSGLVLMESIDADTPRHSEIGLSMYNTSLLHASETPGGRWLVSARRGNLDVVLDDKLGRPAYYDLFAELELELNAATTLRANALYADDIVTVVLEADPEEREEARSTTANAQLWIDLENRWSEELTSRTALSLTDYRNRRAAVSNDEEKLVATLRDHRDVRQIGFRQDWTWRATPEHFLQWGFAITSSEAQYDYAANAEYFGLPALLRGSPGPLSRTLAAAPDGASYALYIADRWQYRPDTILEWGLRWDDQTWTGLSSDSQLSPRLSLLRRLGRHTDLRLSWGRYHQSQGIHELQVEDGIANFWPAQRADHYIASLTRRLSATTSLRAELFLKDMRDLRPRFENLYDPLALMPELAADRVRLEPSRARATGFELSLDGTRGPWSWWAAWTLSESTDRIAGRDEPRSWDQRQALQAGATRSGERWTLAAALSVHSGWPTTGLTLVQTGTDAAGEPVYAALPGPRNAERHNTFASVDLRIARRIPLRRGQLSLFFEVSNVANRRNVCCIDWDLADAAGGGLLLDSSADYWLPLLPAVGVLWEF